MEKPRIAWLLTSAFFYWQPMLSQLAQRFPDFMAFTAKWSGYAPGLDNAFPVEVLGNRRIVTLTHSETGYGTSFTLLPFNIVNKLFSFQPQVIFSNSFGVWTILALMLKPLGHWKVVIAYEGSSPSVDFRNSPIRLAIRRQMVRWADACITNSQAGRDYLREILKAPQQQVFVQPYEVPSVASLFQDQTELNATAGEQNRPIFLFVGSITSRKGLHWLLEACAILEQQGTHQYTLQILGSGPLQPQLQAFCHEHDLTDRVDWVGHVDYGQLGDYFRHADVFVLPSLEDTWGVVVLEAMCLGKPVLCSQWAGASELIQEGENGYIFEPQNPCKLAEAMSKLIHDPDLLKSMGDKSHEIMAQYSPEAAAQFLADVTTFVLKSSAAQT